MSRLSPRTQLPPALQAVHANGFAEESRARDVHRRSPSAEWLGGLRSSKSALGLGLKRGLAQWGSGLAAWGLNMGRRHSTSKLAVSGYKSSPLNKSGSRSKLESHATPTPLLRRLPVSLIVLLVVALWMLLLILCRTFILLRGSNTNPVSSLSSCQRGQCPGLTRGMRLAIYSVPLAHNRESLDIYKTALKSWLKLQDPAPHIFLLGSHPSLQSLAQLDPTHIHVDADVDANMEGVPQFHSVLARAAAAGRDADLVLLVDPTVVLFPDLLTAASKVSRRFPRWVMAGASWSLSKRTQDRFVAELDKSLSDNDAGTLEALAELARDHGRLQVRRSGGGVSLGLGFLSWSGGPPWRPGMSALQDLVAMPVPPFAMGRGSNEEWVMHHMAKASLDQEGSGAGARQVVDASGAVSCVRLRVAPPSGTQVQDVEGAARDMLTPKSWEFFANSHMAVNFGQYSEGQGSLEHYPWHLAKCYGTGQDLRGELKETQESSRVPAAQALCLMRRVRPGNCSCQHSVEARASSSGDVRVGDREYWSCGQNVQDQFDFFIDPTPLPADSAAGTGAVTGLPHSLEQLLPRVADQHRVVVLVAVVRAYAEMALNFICMLQSLGITNFLIAALDHDTYRYAFVQGLPVYYASEALVIPGTLGKDRDTGDKERSRDSAQEGVEAAAHVVLRSKAVLRILRLGYNVLHSDPDTVWFKDPLPHLRTLSPEAILVQSNEPRESAPANGLHTINSGFYYAPAEKHVIEAFESVVARASQEHAPSEQATFYDVLCGQREEHRVGKDACLWPPSKQEVLFLDRRQFPNGAVFKIWSSRNVARRCERLGCLVLHNNFISGKGAKMERFRQKGFIFYDEVHRMCRRRWFHS